MINNKYKILQLIKWIPILGIISISAILILISLYGINKYFNQRSQELEKDTKQQMINTAVNNIHTIKSLSKDINMVIKNSFKREVKLEVNSGFTLINEIYKNYKSYPKEEIIKKVKERLRNFRFFDDKSGYFFIYDKSGKVILLPIKPSLEGKNLWNHQDIKGKYIIQDLMNGLKKNPNGVFEEWYYYLPNTNIMKKKIGYAKYYKKLDLMIGTAVYYMDIEKEMKKQFIHTVSKIDKANYSALIVLDENGKIVYAKNQKLKKFHNTYHTKLYTSHCIKEIIELAKSDINKIHMHYSKSGHNILQIISYYKPLKMIIVNRIDLGKIEIKIKKNTEELNSIANLMLTQFLLIASIFILFGMLISLHLSKKIKNIFLGYEQSLIKAKEIAQKNSKTKSEFLANMSHEIRTPLNAMLGFIQILKEKDFSQEDQGHLSIVEKSGQSLLAIINDILDFSKIEAGKFQVEHIAYNPKEDTRVTHELFSAYASEKNILLETVTENLRYNIISDATRVKQVIANLLSNAIKFTSKNKKIKLNVKYNDETEKLFVEVIDEGIGIPKDKLDTIFQAFTQADSSTTRKYGGTGLGLTISYRLIQLLGGELKVESKQNVGSRFFFEIPALKDSKIEETYISKVKTAEKLKFNYHVLLVEDNRANQMFMKVLFKKLGVTFDIANDGAEAVDKFKLHKYDIIFMDENMPVMNGIEATKIIRQIEKDKKLKHIAIVALTANSLKGDEERFIESGMDAYLAKPLDVKKLVDIFKKFNEEGM